MFCSSPQAHKINFFILRVTFQSNTVVLPLSLYFKTQTMKVNSFNNVFYFCIFIQLIGVASINHSNGGEFRSEDDIVKIFPKKDLNSSKKRFRTNEETVSKHWNGHSNQRIIRQSFLDLSQVIHSYIESLPDTLQVQIFEDEEPISFQKQFERSDDRGFYWYGENSDFDSSFGIQVHGPDCMGYV